MPKSASAPVHKKGIMFNSREWMHYKMHIAYVGRRAIMEGVNFKDLSTPGPGIRLLIITFFA